MSTAIVLQPNPLDLERPKPRIFPRPWISACIVVAADLFSLCAVIGASFGVVGLGMDKATSTGWLELWPVLFLLLFTYWLLDLHPAISISPVDELRRIALANTVGFLCLVTILLLRHSTAYLGAVVVGWIVSCAVIPASRGLVRSVACQYPWWGYPVAVFGSCETARSVFRKLLQHPETGLRPVAIIDDRPETSGDVDLDRSRCIDLITSRGVKHALIVAPKLSTPHLVELIGRQRDLFPHVVVVHGMDGICNVSSQTRDVVGMLAIQIRNNLLLRSSQVTKRVIDLILCALASIVILPVLAAIAILIKLESSGPVFFFQKRVGQDGRTFHIWKFRTMVKDAASIFERQILSNAELSKEWVEKQKLRNDPRITRVGRILRRTSLDELPQLWNVITGDMSLVGPRPLPVAEISKYSKYESAYSLYAKVVPGLTGLWQVSGRSRTTYTERVEYDSYYVRNWSVWMDIYLLARTVGVVLTGDGAI